jgi:hypothetical protein
MKGLPFDRSDSRADLLVHLGLGVSVLAAVILAVAAMLNFGSGVDAIATRLTVPCPGADAHYLVGDPLSPTNLARRQSPASQPGAVVLTNAQPTAAHPAPNRTAG